MDSVSCLLFKCCVLIVVYLLFDLLFWYILSLAYFAVQNYMDLSKGHIRALQDGDLTTPKGIEACINAAEALSQCMNVALRPGWFFVAFLLCQKKMLIGHVPSLQLTVKIVLLSFNRSRQADGCEATAASFHWSERYLRSPPHQSPQQCVCSPGNRNTVITWHGNSLTADSRFLSKLQFHVFFLACFETSKLTGYL